MHQRLLRSGIVLALATCLCGCGASTVDGDRPEADGALEDVYRDGISVDTSHVDISQQDADVAVATDVAQGDEDSLQVDAPVDIDATPDALPDALPTCAQPLGAPCNPVIISQLPYTDSRDTTAAPSDQWDAYGCAPAVDESGGEVVYRLEVTERGVLQVAVDDLAGDQIDIDVHLLDALDPSACVQRANVSFEQLVEPGVFYLVADTWVDASGSPMSGAYTLTVSWLPADGNCAVVPQDLRMFWSSCDPATDCYVDGADVFVRTPSTGPVVKEAHLVTTADGFGGSWPTSFTDGIANHYTMSQGISGFAASRAEPWAPAGEGGSQYGQGATGSPLPPDAEAWYVNMYWRDRPAPGTRMVIRNPANGKAVVAAAGYETGPGSNTALGGVVEEVHLYLGTGHRDVLEFGFAADQTLPFGPIVCE